MSLSHQPSGSFRALSAGTYFKRWLTPGLVAALLVALLAVAPISAGAADAVFPAGSRLGIAPPGDMRPSRNFQGFEDSSQAGVILLVDLPGLAYPDLEKAMTADALGKQGLVVEKREPFAIGDGKAVLVTGRQDTNGNRVRKWVMLAQLADVTALVTVQILESKAANYPDADVQAALASLRVRATPIAEQIEMMSFRVEELAGFRIARVTPPNAILLTDGAGDDIDKQSNIVIAVGPGGPDQAGDRGEFARQAMGAVPGFKEMRITSAEPLRVTGQPGYEVRADAKNVKNDTPVAIVQWLRFGSGGFMRMIAVAPKDTWAEAFPRFRAIRDGVTPR